MLPRERAEKILTLGQAGWSVPAIAAHLGHSKPTIRDYLTGRRTPGVRAPRPSLLTDLLAGYCRQRLVEDPHLRPNTLFDEVLELGFQGSLRTFYREMMRLQPGPAAPRTFTHSSPQNPAEASRPFAPGLTRTPVLPRQIAPVSGETLISYLNRLAAANHLTISEVLAVLPAWFTTKTNNVDDRSRHHMLTPATTDALKALARLTGASPAGLARALPAFDTDTHGPIRATTACHRCTARRGVLNPVPVHLPAHHKVCTRHGVWLSDIGQPHLDLAACPEIITAQHRTNRLMRRYTPQQLLLAYQAAAKSIPAWPTSPTAIPLHWRHRLLRLQTTNHRYGIATDHDDYIHAAIYPDAIALTLAAAELKPRPAGPE
jgi:hypothetical protein